MTLRYLIQKEFLQIRRNSFMPKVIFIFPIVIMCVMPWVMNQEVKNIVVDVVDNDRSVLSRQLVHRIESSPYFIFGGQKATYNAALREIEQGHADIILVIPQDYSRNRTKGHPSQVLIAANAVNGTKGAIGSSYLSQIVMANSASQAEQSLIATLHLYNKSQSYKVFMIPALMGILMMMLCGFLPALNIVGEKEKGTIEQINVTPVSKWAFILAKLIPYWIIGMLVLTVCLVLSWAVYGITCQGPLVLVYLLAILLALFFSSLGLIISNYSDTMQQAMLVMWFFVVCLMLLSGLFTPTRSMPDWAYATTYVNPMHYFIDAIRTVFVRGGGIESVAHQVLALLGLSSAMAVWAVLSYKKNS
ncbi:MAG: ABC transporter permease [Prevotella sp.]|nr:ABC transporter permease [Prevotella sp.]